jgi:uncharacterized protein (DUF2062 family)
MLIPESMREFFRHKILRPVLCLLRDGITPRRMAWSLAIGMVIGINPSVGITTLLVILLAWVFGLNQVASQIGTHLVAPFHLLLFVPFIEAGVYLFRTRHLPLNARQIEHLSHHPLRMVQEIWQWEWHALIIWAIVAAAVTPVLAIYLRRGLVMFMRHHKTLIRSVPATL